MNIYILNLNWIAQKQFIYLYIWIQFPSSNFWTNCFYIFFWKGKKKLVQSVHGWI